MAISTGLALLGAAGIGLAGSVIGGSKQAKAANQASQMTAADNAANRAFQQNVYNQNAAFISPWQRSGATANNAIMELLGYPQQSPQLSAFGFTPVPGATGAFPAVYGPYSTPGINPDAGSMYGHVPGGYAADSWSPESWGGTYGDVGMPVQMPGAVTTQAPSARSAFDTYRGSTGYDFRVNEGVRALQAAFSRNLESGGASKAAIRYGQGTASDEFARYMGYLTGQSQLGLSGASALAGVGQNFANNVVAGNQAATTAQANARLYAGNSAANMWNNIGSSFGMGLGALSKGF